MIGFNPTDSYSCKAGISIYSNPCLCPLGLPVIFIIAIIAIIGVLCAYFVLKLIQKWKLYLFTGSHTSINLTNFISDHLPEGCFARETDLLYLKLYYQWIQQVLNTQNPIDIFDPRFQGRTNTSDERYNISNRNIYSITWGVASLTLREKYRLCRIARVAYNNESLQALGYEIHGSIGVIRHIDNRMIAKCRIALIAILAANDR